MNGAQINLMCLDFRMSQSCVYPLLALGIMCAIFTGSGKSVDESI